MSQALIIRSKQPLQERIRDFVGRLDAEVGVDKAFLFGSTATGKRHRNSDVDLIIVSSSFEDMPELDRLFLLQHRWRYIEDLEAFAYTPKEFEKLRERLLVKKILSCAVDLTPKRKLSLASTRV